MVGYGYDEAFHQLAFQSHVFGSKGSDTGWEFGIMWMVWSVVHRGGKVVSCWKSGE